MKFCPLFSGSAGNSTIICEGETYILVDAGFSGTKLQETIKEAGFDESKIKGILVTHEHDDHVKCLGVLARRLDIPVYANAGIMAFLENKKILKKVQPEHKIIIDKNTFTIGDISVRPFSVSHDAVCPYGYVFSKASTPDVKELAIVTDTGVVTDEIAEAVVGTKAILLESNHDISMLEFGYYPFELKERIKGEKGHLSNEACAEFAVKLAKNGTGSFVLGHLSHDNNCPELALETTRAAFKLNGIENVNLLVAKRESPIQPLEID